MTNLKEFANDNLKLDENGGKFFNKVANTVGKGEIACCEQFLLLPQCFQNTCTAVLTLSQTKNFSKRVEITVEKGEICKEQISPFSTVFSKDL